MSTGLTARNRTRLEPYLGDIPSAQRHTLAILSFGLVLSGLGLGVAMSLGSLLIVSVTQTTSTAGLSSAMSTLGAAVFAIPLAMMASRFGRRISLTTGALIAATGAVCVILADRWGNFPLMLASMIVLGAGNATSLQSRFSAGDLAAQATRGRDMSLVVWAMTIGTVIGPNLAGPGDAVGMAFGLPTLAGAFLFTVFAQLAASITYFVLLRPDPLLLSRLNAEQKGLEHAHKQPTEPVKESSVRIVLSRPTALVAVVTMALSNATMVAVMAMTPVHLAGMSIVIAVIGLTLSLHIAGMYAFSPVFGWLTDRIGFLGVIVLGQLMFAASLLLNWLNPDSMPSIITALILLGLGWSASTVAGAVMLTGSLDPAERPRVQGVSDTVMMFTGTLAGVSAGPVLTALGYSALNAITLSLVIVVLSMVAFVARRRRSAARSQAKP